MTAGSVDELLAHATGRQPIDDGAGKSGAQLERVIIDGEPYVVKYLDLAEDWTMRAAGVLTGVPHELWRRGVLADLPECIFQPIVGIAPTAPRPGVTPSGGCVLLMHDVSAWLVPVSDEPVPLQQHLTFLDHMAAIHAHFWNCDSDVDVVPAMHRYLELSPWMAEAEASVGSPHRVPQLVGEGWPRFAELAPAAAAIVLPLARDPSVLVEALAATPQTFIHGNWKLDNLGSDDLGRTVLLDWELPGRSAACADLAWYLSINCRRLPQSKEAAIDAYRTCLTAYGIDTDPWWDRQLGLSLLGALVQFGWEKALGGYDDELVWWEEHAVAAASLLE